MAYENNDKKFVAVINRKHSFPVILNALAHVAFGISGKSREVGRLLDYGNIASGFVAKIDEYPFIILEAKNSNQIQTLVASTMTNPELFYNVFTTSMLQSSAETQMLTTLNAPCDELDFVVAVIFGARENVEPLTKRFSLFKG